MLKWEAEIGGREGSRGVQIRIFVDEVVRGDGGGFNSNFFIINLLYRCG